MPNRLLLTAVMELNRVLIHVLHIRAFEEPSHQLVNASLWFVGVSPRSISGWAWLVGGLVVKLFVAPILAPVGLEGTMLLDGVLERTGV